MANVAWFKELSKDSLEVAGGKGASLAEMYNAQMPIPPGFAVTAQAYKFFIESTGINEEIYSILDSLNVDDNQALQEASKKINEIFMNTDMPEDIQHDISEAYDNLNIDADIFSNPLNKNTLDIIKTGRDLPFVAVRSSATAEDLPTASFAGQQATYLNIKGNSPLLTAVKKCWASLFTARAIFYRVKNNFPHNQVFISVIVQKMVNSEKSGVIFSVNPLNNNENEILIEAGWGLGEAVVSGAINPDEYIVMKEDFEIKNVNVQKQDWMFTLDLNFGKTVKQNINGAKAESQVLNEFEIVKLAKLAKKIEKHYQKPQDLEFAIDGANIYIVQSRPITTLKKKGVKEESNEPVITDKKEILSGIGASPGVGSGKVKIIRSPEELNKIEKGDVLVAEMTNPDYVTAMAKAAGIVTDSGGATCHAAIVSREMGIPCIVATNEATKKLQDGQEITVDGTTGKVYEGLVKIEQPKEEYEDFPEVDTITQVKVVMDLPDFAEKAAETGADGIGLLRGEFINLKSKVHPFYMIQHGQKDEFVENLVNNLLVFCKAFKDKPIWYRTLDAPTDEFRGLEGGDEEPREENPMLGWRSIRRSLDQPELLKAEYEAIKKVHDIGFTNLGIMIPLVTHVSQITEAKKILKEVGLEPMENIEFGVMVETPAAVQIIEEICKEGIDFVSFGTNDLTQFTLAIDRNNAKIQKLYDEMHPAVLRQIAHVIKVCREYNVETSICGQAGSRPEMAEFLVKKGIDSISANPDAVKKIKHIVAKVERRLLLDVARQKLEEKDASQVKEVNEIFEEEKFL